MARKLFEEDVMRKSCQAVVTACREMKKGYGLELDQTVFYPEGGGQLSDTGELLWGDKSVKVTHVREKEGHILHETEEPVPVGTKVEARLHWQSRFDHMQQHCGEHLLSFGFWKLCGADNIGFHMSEEMVAIDLSKEVTSEEIAQVEALANEQIQADLPVTTEWMEAAEAAEKAKRKFNDKLTGPVRVVAIKGSDSCTCCGTHPPRTGMVGLVKIFKAEKHKQGTRISFLCGRLALEKINACWQGLAEAAKALSLKEEKIADGVTRLLEENRNLRERLGALERQRAIEMAGQLLKSSPAKEGIIDIVVQEDLSPESAQVLAQELSKEPQVRGTIFYTQKDRLNYILVQGEAVPGSCREGIASLNNLLGGRGGGKDRQAQGSAPLREGWQELVKERDL